MTTWVRWWSVVIVAVAVLCVPSRAVEWPDERLADQSPEAKQVIAKLEAGDEAGAIKLAGKLIRKKPDVVDLPVLLGAIHAGNGAYDDAIEAWKRAVRGRDTDVVPLAMMARLHEERAKLGPGGAHVAGGIRYSGKEMKADRDTFVQAQYRAGAECLAQIIARQPRALTYQVKRLEFLVSAKEFAAARAAGEEYLKLNPENGDLWRLLAEAEVAAGDQARARAAAEQAVRWQPNNAPACRVMADILRRAGDANAESWAQRARFHAYVPEFLHGSFSPEAAAFVDVLSFPANGLRADGSPDEQVQKKWQEAARQVIQELEARKDESSSQLLAAAAWRHEWHGEVENGIFAELERRRAESLLIALFDHAESTCTVGGAAPALARMKSDAVFAAMIERLPQDRSMFPMGLPESLALYQRPEAVKALDAAVRVAIQEQRRAGQGVDALMAGMGTRLFVERCLWSLATFKTPEARQALEQVAADRDWAIEAGAALYVQSGDAAILEKLLQRLKREPKQAEGVAEQFRAHGLESAAQAVAVLIPKAQKSE